MHSIASSDGGQFGHGPSCVALQPPHMAMGRVKAISMTPAESSQSDSTEKCWQL